ncbi:hypothetical protein MNBD_CPR01-357 [hydrothermal vent metagenome]|uniref:DUF5673 domain-containing protein n=1 Tax=hydrothermal vent metagenome TaxID=652676 RepID=A0A3B0UNZ5_9ZZZZ
MQHTPRFVWDAQEYEFDDKPAEWYWGLGVIATASIIASILFGNYLLAIVFLTATFTIGLQATKKPNTHHIILSEQGLAIGHRLYSFEIMHSFSMFEHIDKSKSPILSIKTNSLLTPHLLIPLDNVDADEVYAFLFAYIDEGLHQETLLDHIVEFLRL